MAYMHCYAKACEPSLRFVLGSSCDPTNSAVYHDGNDARKEYSDYDADNENAHDKEVDN